MGPVPDEIVRIQDEFYIVASSSRIDDRKQVLKHGESFAVFDRMGDIAPVGLGELGIYHEGTRFVSRLSFTLGGVRPLLLSSAVREDNTVLVVDLTNPDILHGDAVIVPHGSIHIFREKMLWHGVCYETIRATNYGVRPVELTLATRVDGDFADIFEVRGISRARRGRLSGPSPDADGFVLGYAGLDGVARRLRVRCSPSPRAAADGLIEHVMHLEPQGEDAMSVTFACEIGDKVPELLDAGEAHHRAMASGARAAEQDCRVASSNEQFDDWIDRSIADLHMMATETSNGPYPYAGVPWFSTAFGRDGMITALQMLWVNPLLARAVLGYLAENQADRYDEESDAQPGKILHEMRRGEMAATGEIPFGRYYGSVDSTPLFVILAGAYFEATGDESFVRTLWPSIERALRWLDTDGDPDGDGFIEYARRSTKGLVHQGWKDSHDAVFHADGSLAEPPIALCEVQGYAYAARRAASKLAEALDDPSAGAFTARAAEIKKRFERTFWSDEIASYVLALDGAKRQCRVRASNAGHCLWTGIAHPERARRVARTLTAPDFFTGWGVRTLSTKERRYNPMSYHNGSIWPHDNAIVAMGLSRYGLTETAFQIFAGLFDASSFMELRRLPELFCGFDRSRGSGPTLYPVACAPQAWAAGAPFMLLQACLGLSIHARAGRVVLRRPLLPPSIQQLWIRNLRVGKGSIDLALERYPENVGVNVTRRTGRVEVQVIK